MKAYLLVGFVSGVFVSQSADWSMVGRIQSGMVALDLTKPVNYQTARFAGVVGAAWPEALAGAVVIAGVVLVTGPAATPPTAAAAALFAVSLLAILPLKFLVVYMTSLAAFHTQNYLGLHWARLAVVSILSGALVPLSFFPGWLQAAAAVLPFASMAATPGLIYLGHVDGLDAVRLIAIQFGWVLVLWVGARLVWRRAVTRVTIHGG
jgi:ABC-2 type transport system permease protein